MAGTASLQRERSTMFAALATGIGRKLSFSFDGQGPASNCKPSFGDANRMPEFDDKAVLAGLKLGAW